jgi:hypothetical protein
MIKEIKRIRIRSVLRLLFLFHAFLGLFVGLILAVLWGVISLFEMYELVPSFLGDVGDPTTSSILILLSISAISLGILGALVWFLIALLYNVIAGFVRGIEIEVVPRKARSKKNGDQENGG